VTLRLQTDDRAQACVLSGRRLMRIDFRRQIALRRATSSSFPACCVLVVEARGVQEHNQYSHSLPFPLANSHSRVLIFLFPFPFKFCYFVPLPPELLPKKNHGIKTVQCQISKLIVIHVRNASLTTIYQLQSTNTQVL